MMKVVLARGHNYHPVLHKENRNENSRSHGCCQQQHSEPRRRSLWELLGHQYPSKTVPCTASLYGVGPIFYI